MKEIVRKNIFSKAFLPLVGGFAFAVTMVSAQTVSPAVVGLSLGSSAVVGVTVGAAPGTESIWAVNANDEIFVATAATVKTASIQIVNAQWGDFIASTRDVTEELKTAIKAFNPAFPNVNHIELSNKNDALVVKESPTPSALPAAWQYGAFKIKNPIWAVRKKLVVQYTINDQSGSVVVMDGDPLVIEAPATVGITWKKVDGALKHVAVGPYGVWGVNAQDLIWFRPTSPSNLAGTGWTQVGGNLKQIDVGQHGDVWGVQAGDKIFFREGVTAQNPMGTAWRQVDGALAYVSVGDDVVWGVQANGSIFYRAGITTDNRIGTAWKQVQGWAAKISVFGNNVWHIGGSNTPYFIKDSVPANPAGTGWQQLDGQLTHVSLGLYSAWGIGNDGKTPYVRAGMGPNNFAGTKWVPLDGSFKQIDVGYVVEPASVEVKTPSGVDIKPGGSTVTIAGRKGNQLVANMTFGWELPKVGEGLITFSGKAQQNIVIVLAPTAKYEDGKCLTLSIGASNNTKTFLRTVAMNDKDQQAFVDDSIIQPDFNDFWIMLKDNTFSYGKGLLPGFNPIVSWSDPMVATLKYVAFGCWEDFKVELKEIKPLPVPEYAEPVGFEEEEGEAVAIAVGSRTITEKVTTPASGKTPAKVTEKTTANLEVWALGKDGGLFHYNAYSMNPMPWDRIAAMGGAGDLKIKSISVSSDGLLYLVTAGTTDKESLVYTYDWTKKVFNQLAGTAPALTRISVGNSKEIWAVTVEKDIVRYDADKKEWAVISKGLGQDVAAGVDGTIMSINTNGAVFKYLGADKWELIPGIELARIAVGSQDYMWGIDKLGGLWMYTVATKKWEQAKDKNDKPVMGIVDVGVNAAGTTFLIDFDYDISFNGDDGFIVQTVATTKTGTTGVKGTTQKATKTTRKVAKKTGKVKVTSKKQKKAAKKAKVVAKAKTATKGKKVTTQKSWVATQRSAATASGKVIPKAGVTTKTSVAQKITKAAQAKVTTTAATTASSATTSAQQ